MAVYKVIQDVESEDKLLGPLTLKGFIYAAGAGLLAFLSIRLAIGGVVMPVKILFITLFFPPMLLLAVLASPLGREQPTEIWLLSRVRFMLKSKSRLWNQSGLNDLVTVTAPKKINKRLTKDITSPEVTSRLQALANTLDSRGWAIKNVAINLSAEPAFAEDGGERLASASTIIAPAPEIDIHAADDILDEQNNPTAQKLSSLVNEADQKRKADLQDKLDSARTLAKEYSATDGAEGLTDDEKELLNRVHAQSQKVKSIHLTKESPAVTPVRQPVKLELANAGNALSVASIAQLANRSPASPGEVSVELH